jgi:hypothetical protein
MRKGFIIRKNKRGRNFRPLKEERNDEKRVIRFDYGAAVGVVVAVGGGRISVGIPPLGGAPPGAAPPGAPPDIPPAGAGTPITPNRTVPVDSEKVAVMAVLPPAIAVAAPVASIVATF